MKLHQNNFCCSLHNSSASTFLLDYQEPFKLKETLALKNMTVSFLSFHVRKKLLPYFSWNLLLRYCALKYVMFVSFRSSEFLHFVELIKGHFVLWANVTAYWFFSVFMLYGGLFLFLSMCLRFNLFRHFSNYLTYMAANLNGWMNTQRKIASDCSSLPFRIKLKTVYFVPSVEFLLFMSHKLCFSQ